MENEFNYEKYAWEFMRRDKNFRKVFDEYIRLYKEDLDGWHLMVKSMHLLELFPGCDGLPNPYKPFEEAFKPVERMHFYKYVLSVEEKHEKKFDKIVITIKIDGVKAIKKIKDVVIKEIGSALTNKYVNLIHRKNSYYDMILRVGDLKEEGLTPKQIAMKEFPDKFHALKGDQEKNVRSYIKIYDALIELFRLKLKSDVEMYRETKTRLESEPDPNDDAYWNKEIERAEKLLDQKYQRT